MPYSGQSHKHGQGSQSQWPQQQQQKQKKQAVIAAAMDAPAAKSNVPQTTIQGSALNSGTAFSPSAASGSAKLIPFSSRFTKAMVSVTGGRWLSLVELIYY
ncbi:hypothetical protein FBUS_05480 [Fasciolopsis buskii]|uniref:Uncharacterized protein n=1 Tax=Fasciolopsis buskii TaxID=27845 RepID=A0A8E0RY42_9TREM|nr:hypothetical protein FBUS_05480 [Fasciolopsis buski]